MPMNKIRMLIPCLLMLVLMLSNSSAQTPQECQSTGTATILAPWYCNNINEGVANVWYQWEPLVVIAIFVAFSVAAVIFMTGIVLRNERIRNFAVAELYEAVATTLIVVMFMSLAAILFGIIPASFIGPLDPYVTSLSYINATINAAQLVLTNVYRVFIIDYFYQSLSVSVSLGPAGTSALKGIQTSINTVGTTAKSVLGALGIGIQLFFLTPGLAISRLLIDGLLVLHAEFYTIIFFMYTAIPAFLIPGIIFRSLFPLRNLGGLMIAMAIVFFLIVPVLFSVAYAFTHASLVANLDSYAQQIAAYGQGTSAQTNAGSPTAPLVVAIQGLEGNMGTFWLSILFFPALIIAIGYESVTIIAEFLGGAVQKTSRVSITRGL